MSGDDYHRNAHAYAARYDGANARAIASNLDAGIAMLRVGERIVPVTVNDAERGNAWVCSPRTTYADYAAEEARRLLPAVPARAIAGLCSGLGGVLGWAQLDRVVAINNWCVSTNLYPPLQELPLDALLRQARERWPTHALWLRSLNTHDNPQWLAALQARGFRLIASRQIYLYPELSTQRRGRDLSADLKLLQRTDLQRVGDDGIGEDDYPRIAALYAMLYLDKYSHCNPAYHPQMLRDWHRDGLLRLEGFRDADGQLQCIAGMFGTAQAVTTPIVGYDTSQPQKMALYRTLAASSFRAALDSGRLLNLSAGAATFKRQRGGQPMIEYSAVLDAHRPRRTRAAVQLLSTLTRHLGIPLMRRYRL